VKAIFQDGYGDIDVLALRDVSKPQIKADEFMIHVEAAGLDPGVWHLMTGRPYLVRLVGFALRKQPLGMDFAGVVEASGSGASGLIPGDEVFGTCHGSFAEFATARGNTIARKPSNLSIEHAAAVPVSACTALQALRDQARVRAGQTVLVIGAGGGVGTFAVQIARAFGADVTGVCSAAKTDLVRSIGANDVIDYTSEDFTDGRRRFDVIVDTAGRRSLSCLRRALAPRGTLVVVGGEGGGSWLGGFDRGYRGLAMSPFAGQRIRPLLSKVNHQDLLVLTDLIEDGKVNPVIDRTFVLSEVPNAIRYWRNGQAQGKVVITV
jgi:NADPH:quinone reductase-like Zn-dependent oxidoreductase